MIRKLFTYHRFITLSLFTLLAISIQAQNSCDCVTWPADVFADCDEETEPENTGSPIFPSPCDMFLQNYSDQEFISSAGIEIIRTWQVFCPATDESVTYNQSIFLQDTEAPELVCASFISASLDANGTVVITEDQLVLSMEDNCSDVQITLSNDTFTCSDIGTKEVIVNAVDDFGNYTECTVTVLIEDKIAPSAVCVSALTANLGTDGTLTLLPEDVDAGSSDNCGAITYSLSQTEFDCSDIGTLNNMVLTVTDASGNTGTCELTVQIGFDYGNEPPTITCPNDVTINCGDSTDPANTGLVTFESPACATLAYSYQDGVFSSNGVQKIIRTWTVMNFNNDQSSSCVQEITLIDNTAPLLALKQSVNISLDEDGVVELEGSMFDAGTTDDCGNVTITVEPLQVDCNDIGNTTVTVTATDEQGNQSTGTVPVLVEDKIAPTAVCLTALVANLDSDGTLTLLPEDVDAGSSDNCGAVTYSLSQTEFDCSDIGTLNNMVLTVTDASGNTATCELTVQIGFDYGNEPPTITCPNDVTINCGDSTDPANTGLVTFENPACATLAYSYQDGVFSSNGVQKIIRTWTVVNFNNDQSSSCVQEITLIDNTAPLLALEQSVSIFLDGDGVIELEGSMFDAGTTDDCGNVTITVSPSQVDCNDIGNTTVTVTATDEQGNQSTGTVPVLVEDNIAPTAVCVSGIAVALGADGTATILPEDVDVGSSDNCGITSYSLDRTTYDCSDIGSNITVTLTVSDASGNTSSCQLTVDVQDNGNYCCSPMGSITQYEWIDEIGLNGVYNFSGSDDGYGDYSSFVFDAQRGSNSLTLTPGFAYGSYAEYWTIWIDLDQNGVYDSDEIVYTGSSSSTINAALDIPLSTALGNTSMRVAMQYGSAPDDPCATFQYGEVEDYTINISETEYCESQGASTQYEYIRKVRLKDINNASGDDGGYADYKYLSTTLNPGQTKTIRLKPGFTGGSYLEYWTVWVDWNRDGDFDDFDELEVQAASSGNVVDAITVPSYATPGAVVMRVSMNYDGYAEACDNFQYGEVEDYTINISGISALVQNETETNLLEKEAEQLTTRSNDGLSDIELKIYPNPAIDFVKIEASYEGQLLIIDQTGKIMRNDSQIINGDHLDISDFPSGMYWVIHIDEAGQKTREKLIIQK